MLATSTATRTWGRASNLQSATKAQRPTSSTSFGGLRSLGFGAASSSGMKHSIQRLVRGIACSLFCEDRAHHLATLRAFDERKF
jgi:hypothetical protein